jgi:hypothetical protein
LCMDAGKGLADSDVRCADEIKALLQAKAQQMAMGSADSMPADPSPEQAAAMLNAEKGISATLSKLGSTLMLQLTLVNYKTAKIESRAMVQADADKETDILTKVPEAILQLVKNIKK